MYVHSLIAFPFGLIIGSFLNVVIHRVPRGEEIVFTPSHCPNCSHALAWYENIPVFSFLALRGRCRRCAAPIARRYFIVELLTGLMFAVLALVFGFSPAFFKHMVFGALMIALMFIDLEQRLLPDALTLPGMAAGFAASLLVPLEDGTGRFLARAAGLDGLPSPLVSLVDSLLGAAAGAGLLWFVLISWKAVFKEEGMGFGDVKLMALVGAFLGIKLALLTIFLGSLAGSIIGGLFIALTAQGRKYELPFGTFLGGMALFAALFGKEIVHWYLSIAF